tara:strand:- start:252 stop:899 length:648 start_codon:yes stop_codon:yes gene_type:complete
MPFIGRTPTPVPLTSSDITDGIISTAKIANDAVDNTKLDLTDNFAFTGTITGAGGGKVLQVVQVAKSDTYNESISANSISSTLVTGLQPSITPSSSSNKVLVQVSLTLGYSSNDVGDSTGFLLKRGSTAISRGDASSSRSRLTTGGHFGSTQQVENFNMIFLDSPSTTSATTYGINLFNGKGSTAEVRVNYDNTDGDGGHTARCISTITLMEIEV